MRPSVKVLLSQGNSNKMLFFRVGRSFFFVHTFTRSFIHPLSKIRCSLNACQAKFSDQSSIYRALNRLTMLTGIYERLYWNVIKITVMCNQCVFMLPNGDWVVWHGLVARATFHILLADDDVEFSRAGLGCTLVLHYVFVRARQEDWLSPSFMY